MRIASLLPSATEIVCQLGLESQLVGVSHECDYPASVEALPRLTFSNVPMQVGSSQIHDSVEDLLNRAVSVYGLEMDALRSLAPDYLITQDLCDVCAVSFSQVEEACHRVLGDQARILSLHPNNLKDIWSDIERVAKALGVVERYQQFRKEVDLRIDYIQNTVDRSGVSKRKTITIEWLDPVMLGGLWIPEMIALAGGESLMVKSGQRALMADREALAGLDPEVILVKPCGFKMQQILKELGALETAVPWDHWSSCSMENVYLVDGNAYFNRPGPRIIDSMEILAYCIHPELFPEFGQRYKPSLCSFADIKKR